jgi:uncharacterized protein (TIGR02996 family)
VSERAAFISAILDDWSDDTARLVFADWLQECGEPERAEFIRVQIEAARVPKGERDKCTPGVRALALEAVYAPAWRAALGPLGNRGRYERGFLTGIDLPTTVTWSEIAAQLLTVEPAAFTLTLWTGDEDESPVAVEDIDQLATNPLLRAVTKINNRDGQFGSEMLVRLLKSPHLVNLREIELFEDLIGLAGVKAIVESPSAFTLERLDLTSALQVDDIIGEIDETLAAVELIATAPRFASLKHLGLRFNELGDRSVEALLASKTLPRNLNLELEDNDFDEERFAEELAKRFSGGSDVGEE